MTSNLIIKVIQQGNNLVSLHPQSSLKLKNLITGKIEQIGGYNSNVTVLESDLPNLVQYNEIIVPSAYVKIVDGNEIFLSPDEYTAQFNLLKSKSSIDIEGDTYWESISDRHSFEIFCSQWKLMTKIVSQESKVEFVIEDAPYETGYKFIVPMRSLSENSLDNLLYVYNRQDHIVNTIRILLIENGYVESDRELSSNGAEKSKMFHFKNGKLEFAILSYPTENGGLKNGYMTIQIKNLKEYERVSGMRGSFNELRNACLETAEKITKIINLFIVGIQNSEKKITDISTLITQLNEIKLSVMKIKPMKNSHNDAFSAVRKISTLISLYENELLKQGE